MNHAQHTFAESGGGGETTEIRRQRWAHASDVKESERVQIATRLGLPLCLTFGKQVERAPEAFARRTHPARDHRLHPGLACRKAQDARRFEVVDLMQYDRIGNDQSHGGA